MVIDSREIHHAYKFYVYDSHFACFVLFCCFLPLIYCSLCRLAKHIFLRNSVTCKPTNSNWEDKTRCLCWRTEYFNVNLFSTASTGQCISITDKLLILLLPSNKAKLISRLVLRQNKGKAYWPIFQLAALVSFRASAVTALNFTAVMLLSLHYSDGPEDD